MVKRTDRLNSLLKEVIADVVYKQVKHPDFTNMATITRVDITRDLRYAAVYVSVIGTDKERVSCIDALTRSAGFIAVTASKQVTMRYFPALRFVLDDSVERHMRIESLLGEIQAEREQRKEPAEELAEGPAKEPAEDAATETE